MHPRRSFVFDRPGAARPGVLTAESQQSRRIRKTFGLLRAAGSQGLKTSGPREEKDYRYSSFSQSLTIK